MSERRERKTNGQDNRERADVSSPFVALAAAPFGSPFRAPARIDLAG
jgi:hypothetical protein